KEAEILSHAATSGEKANWPPPATQVGSNSTTGRFTVMKPRARRGGLTFEDTKGPPVSFSPLPARSCISGDYMKRRSTFALAKQSPLLWVAILLAAGGSLVFAIGA